MKSRTSAGAVSLALAVAATGAVTVVPSASAVEARPAARTITARLDGPFGLQKAVDHRGFVVAESVSGQVTRVFHDGRKRAIINGAPGVAGVATGPHRVFAVLGGPNEEGQPPAGKYGPSTVLRSTYEGRKAKVIADLGKYELAHNPDGQVQFVDGKPVDALSNPFAMSMSKLRPDRRRRRRERRAPGQPEHRPRLDVLRAAHRHGREGVPGPRRPVEPGHRRLRPGPHRRRRLAGQRLHQHPRRRAAGRRPRLQARRAHRQGAAGLAGPDLADRHRGPHDGTVYVSEVLFGAPAGDGPPPPGFDPAKVGRITKISHGRITHAQVTMPTGLQFTGGALYSSAWSIASFLGLQHKGQVVKVPQGAFH